MEKLDEAAHYIPSGKHVWEGRQERFDLTELRCYRALKDTKWLECSLGTLGGGNHFIEIDAAADGTKYLVVHSGSRNLGKQVAEYYQQLAIDLNKGKEEYFLKRDALIAEYKAAGRRTESIGTVTSPRSPKTCASSTGNIWRITFLTWRSASALPAATGRRWRKY